MEFSKLGRTNLQVSKICLGTMTFGEQNSEYEAHTQLDRAVDLGINFIDTAELYPVPPNKISQGRTEEYIGNWLRKTGRRNDLVIATKVIGYSEHLTYFRNETSRLSRNHIEEAIDNSLRRLQIDTIDLYQIHWPDRPTNFFGLRGFNTPDNRKSIPIKETLGVCADLIKSGKIRYIGVSNETPWGVSKWLEAAKDLSSRIVSIQNPYNLLNRSFEIGLSEFSIREDVGLLAYSPLAFGVLSGKYLHGRLPEGSRLSRFKQYDRYNSIEAQQATEAYVALAQEAGLDPCQMALSYINSRPFVTSNIIGATNLNQLESNIASTNIKLTEQILRKIENIHKKIPNPSP